MAQYEWIAGRPVLTDKVDFPAEGDVEKDVVYDDGAKTGTFKPPVEADVRDGEGYGANDNEFAGTLDLPVVGDVEKDVKFDNETKTGTFKVPTEPQVEKDIEYGADGTEYIGTLVPVVNFVGEAIGELEEDDNMVG